MISPPAICAQSFRLALSTYPRWPSTMDGPSNPKTTYVMSPFLHTDIDIVLLSDGICWSIACFEAQLHSTFNGIPVSFIWCCRSHYSFFKKDSFYRRDAREMLLLNTIILGIRKVRWLYFGPQDKNRKIWPNHIIGFCIQIVWGFNLLRTEVYICQCQQNRNAKKYWYLSSWNPSTFGRVISLFFSKYLQSIKG
jgi:hypothetical protein